MSDPYAKLPDPPKDFTLEKALAATVQPDGSYHCGKLVFADRRQYNDFVVGQEGLAAKGTPGQLATLHYVESTGTNPHMEPIEPAPKGTTLKELLDIEGKKPDDQGFYHLGTLKVHESEYKEFSRLQHDLAGRGTEGLALLYHMEHAPDRDVTFRVTTDDDRADRYEPGTNTIYWNPHTIVRDAYDKHLVPPDTAGLHEETHWAGRDVGATLQQIPAGQLENREEQRVIEGTERRDMLHAHHAPRDSHYGWPLPTKQIDSVIPSLTMTRNGVDREMRPPFQQSGRVIDVDHDNGTTTIAIGGDGKNPDQRLTFKTDQLSLAMSGVPQGTDALNNAENLLRNAEAHKDIVKFQLTADDKFLYINPAQEHRQKTEPDRSIAYPAPMWAVAPQQAPAQAQQRQHEPLELGR